MSATFDSKTILMMAENGHSVEIDGKRIQMTIVKEAVEAKPNYSHLVGKWVKCVGQEERGFTKNKWYPVEKLNEVDGMPMFKNDECIIDDFVILTEVQFDLSNPLDHNPDDVRVFDVPSEIKISGYTGSFGLHFGEHQVLWYNKARSCYGVLADAYLRTPIPRIATECKFEDLQEGDLFFATDQKTPHFHRLRMYNFLNKDGGFIWTDGAAVNVLVGHNYTHYFKITPKP